MASLLGIRLTGMGKYGIDRVCSGSVSVVFRFFSERMYEGHGSTHFVSDVSPSAKVGHECCRLFVSHLQQRNEDSHRRRKTEAHKVSDHRRVESNANEFLHSGHKASIAKAFSCFFIKRGIGHETYSRRWSLAVLDSH